VRTPEERNKILEEYQNKDIPAIVDQVWSGSALRMELIPNEKDNLHLLVPIHLAGCTAPRSKQVPNEDAKKDNENTDQTQRSDRKIDVPRWTNEAKEVTEARLLSQRVTIKIVAADQKSNLYAIVTHPKGQIAVSLLRLGLAEYESWTAQLLSTKEQKQMKEAMKSAQSKRLHIWQYKKPDEMPHDFVPATITQILSGDTFMAKIGESPEERFTLSSIRQPRYKEETKQLSSQKGEEGKKKEKPVQVSSQYAEHPWVRSAKEFLREKLIGKKVQLMFEYKKDSKNQTMIERGLTTQKFASVLVDKENVAVALVSAGLAEVIPHGQEESKSVAYLELQRAQEKFGKE